MSTVLKIRRLPYPTKNHITRAHADHASPLEIEVEEITVHNTLTDGAESISKG